MGDQEPIPGKDSRPLWAVRGRPEGVHQRPDFSLARKNLGNAFFRQGKFDQAIEQFEKYLRIEPDSAEIHANAAYALLQKGRFDEAIMHIREIIRMQPNSAVAYSALGDIYQQQGSVSGAVEAFNKALELARAGGDEELARQIQAKLSGLQSQ